jgi:acyl-CoA thioester hydrolase
MASQWFTHHIRVRYQETDQMGIVYHTNYANWMEWGRTELIREAGMPYHRIEEKGLRLPVLSLQIQYKLSAFYDDELTIYTRIRESSAYRVSFDYEIKRADSVLVTGSTEHVWINEQLKPVRLNKHDESLFLLLQSLMDTEEER